MTPIFKSLKHINKDASFSGIIVALIIVLLGMTSSAVLVFQAAESLGLTPEQAGGWMGTVCIVIGISSIFLSLHYRAPVLIAWSTAGAALLVTGLKGFPVDEAIGAFVFSALLIFLSGATGIFEKLMNKIPMALAQALLAGVLWHFITNTFLATLKEPLLVGAMIVAYFATKRFYPRWSMVGVLVVGVGLALAGDRLNFESVTLSLTQFEWVWPKFSAGSLLSIGIPLFAVTMTTQNLTGVAVMRANKYDTPFSPILTWTGILNLISAPLGGFAINLAAITAAIAMGPEADPRRERRYFSAVVAGVIYTLIGLSAGTITAVFAAFPKEMVMAIAGLALISTVLSGLQAAFNKENKDLEATFVTFVVSASGITVFSVGSAFWGLVAGALVLVLFRFNIKRVVP